MNAERQARPVCDYVGGELIYLDCGEPLREYYIDKGYIEIEEVRGKRARRATTRCRRSSIPKGRRSSRRWWAALIKLLISASGSVPYNAAGEC